MVVNGAELTFTVCGTCSALLKGAHPTEHSKRQHECSEEHQTALRVPKGTHKQMSIRGRFAHAAPQGAGSESAPASAGMPAIATTAEASISNQAVAEAGAVNPEPAHHMVDLISSKGESDGSDTAQAAVAAAGPVAPRGAFVRAAAVKASLNRSRVSNNCQGYDMKLPAEANAFHRCFPL